MRLGLLPSAALVVAFAICAGCDSPPSRIYQIKADPVKLAAALVESGDKDKNQKLSQEELKDLPYIAVMADAYDTNHDHQLTVEEIAERLAKVVFDPQKALTPGECIVQRKGSPFTGAEVRLVPAPCLAEYLPVATGKSDRNGVVRLTMEAENRPANAPHVAGLIRPGLYRIEVTHSTIPIPAQYNSQTMLGAEASAAAFAGGPILIQLDF
jgi:hypothetical protein